jgi:hypothetical protein
MTSAEFDELLHAAGEVPRAQKARTKGAVGGFHDASIPRAPLSPIRPNGRPRLKRQLSDVDFRERLPPHPAEQRSGAPSAPGSAS